ncbi:MAG: uncharacterized protein KVP18_004448 [Porospora cf. gigantea A]|uniref:uncharacterized protein n=1 Tax=Porospora cf. gigantea A TaxID=2853593 RepID=UPI00355941EB|nr:MAG: hypothetical protein KVP18_004448 [Porospora cf. gigantea A]
MSTTNPTNIGTEWDDLQVKFGNYAKPEEVKTEQQLQQDMLDVMETVDKHAHLTLADLSEKEDEIEEDDLLALRRKRLVELKARQSAYKFGSVSHVGKTDFVQEVTDVSKKHSCYVVLHLYQDSVDVCRLLNEILPVVARKFGQVKFCKGISSDVIPKFPDANCPTLIIYKDGTCQNQVMGPHAWGGDNVTPESFELWLDHLGVVKSDIAEDRQGEKLAAMVRSKMEERFDF